MEYILLNDGNKIPAIGFGTFQIPADGSTYEAVKTALALGIRHIDTAVAYFNEQEVGQAVKDSGISRDQILSTLYNRSQESYLRGRFSSRLHLFKTALEWWQV